MALVERTVTTGQTITVELVSTGGWADAVAKVDGVESGRVGVKAVKLQKPLMAGGSMYTHYIGKVALKADEATTIETALRAAKFAAQDAQLQAAKAIYPDAIRAKYRGDCAVTDRWIMPGMPITETIYGWAIADEQTKTALETGKGQRHDIISRAMDREDSIF